MTLPKVYFPQLSLVWALGRALDALMGTSGPAGPHLEPPLAEVSKDQSKYRSESVFKGLGQWSPNVFDCMSLLVRFLSMHPQYMYINLHTQVYMCIKISYTGGVLIFLHCTGFSCTHATLKTASLGFITLTPLIVASFYFQTLMAYNHFIYH